MLLIFLIFLKDLDRKRLYNPGVKVRDKIKDVPSKKLMVSASCLNNAPVIPGIKRIGKKTSNVVIVEPKVDEPISKVYFVISSFV